jgi:hypothetical protein
MLGAGPFGAGPFGAGPFGADRNGGDQPGVGKPFAGASLSVDGCGANEPPRRGASTKFGSPKLVVGGVAGGGAATLER